jgi:gamma-glutamylcyclotransferase (GGCT)/AIG2-like uncharacterized protein YtfP
MLFVYGTLRSEFDNRYARLLRSQAELVGAATVPGAIYRVRHYPAYKPEPAGEVHGQLYRLTDAERTLQVLDKYEGEDYERVIVHAAQNQAWIYRYRKELPESSRISSGDFCAL